MILSTLSKVFSSRIAQVFVLMNLVVTILIYFHKPRVPGFRYDYFEEPYYYRVFKTLNVIPDVITGILFYPVFQVWGGAENLWILGPAFHLVVLFFASFQWALVGFCLSFLIHEIFDRRKNLQEDRGN